MKTPALCSLVAFLVLVSLPARADFRVVDTTFRFDRVLDLSTGNARGIEYNYGGPLEADYYTSITARLHQSLEFRGTLTVREYDRDTVSKRTTTLENVYLVMNLYGVVLRAGQVQNLEIPLRGMQGKPISAIFDHRFYGGKIGAGVGLLVGVNPNASFLRNAAGVRVLDMERIIRQADANIGVEIGYVTMKFDLESRARNAKDVNVTASGATVATNERVETVPAAELMDRVVGGEN